MMPTIKRTNAKNEKPATGPYSTKSFKKTTIVIIRAPKPK